jgi:hypothetical protein
MEFDDLSNLTTIGLEGAGALILVALAIKIYRMKIHTRSGCCGERFVIETMNKANSSNDLEFTAIDIDKNKSQGII